MTSSAVALCNQALRLLGEAAISSFDEGSDMSETCNTLWQSTTRSLLASYPWRFTLRKVQLSRRADPPTNEWPYAHALPAGMLALRQMFNTASPGALPMQEYERFGDDVYSRQTSLWADYQVETDPGTWPPAFALLARYALAADFAMPVTSSATAAQLWFTRAYGTPQDNLAGGQMGLARRLDAQQQPPQAITDFPLIAARRGGWAGRVT